MFCPVCVCVCVCVCVFVCVYVRVCVLHAPTSSVKFSSYSTHKECVLNTKYIPIPTLSPPLSTSL